MRFFKCHCEEPEGSASWRSSNLFYSHNGVYFLITNGGYINYFVEILGNKLRLKKSSAKGKIQLAKVGRELIA